MNIRIFLSVAIAVIAVWGGAASQLDILVGVPASKIIVALCSLTVASMAAALGVLSTQGSQATSVANDPVQLAAILKAMPGVSGLTVNNQASPALAKLAMADEGNKIEPAKGAEQAVRQIASAAPAAA